MREPSGQLHVQSYNRNTRTRCEICSRLTINTPERCQWHGSGVFVVSFEHFQYTSGFLKLFCRGSERDKRYHLTFISQTDYSINSKLLILPLFWSHTWKYNIEGSERLTKVKEKWLTIQFDVFDLSFIYFIPMFQTKSVWNKSGVWNFL